MASFELSLFQALAASMNAEPERFRILGDADFSAGLVSRRDGGDVAVRIEFAALSCASVGEVPAADIDAACDFYLDGAEAAWQAMFDDIATNGVAVGRQTINSLALLGTDIRLRGSDPMGVDKFSRFNQTLQEYLDGASRVGVQAS